MQALTKQVEGEGFEYVSMPIPEPRTDEVLLEIKKVALCGSDINLFKWNATAKVIASLPFTPGHEAVGVVVKSGPNVKQLVVGDRVCVENHFYCGSCFQCDEDRGDICADLSQYGHGKGTVHGGCSQFSIVPEKYCYKLLYNISDTDAVLLEPMGVAHNAIERLQVQNEDVMVIGCGPVGLFAIACAKALGAKQVVAADILPGRLELARSMGADVIINSSQGSDSVKAEVLRMTNGAGIGRICEASGAAPMLNGCFSYLRKGGRLSILGLPKQPLHIENVLQDIVFKSLTITTVHGRRIFHTWKECEKLVADNKVKPSLLVSHDVPMSQYHEAFDALLSGKSCKVIMNPGK